MQRQPAAEGEDRDLAERRDRLQQRLVARLQPDRAHLRAVERRSAASATRSSSRSLLAERLDHPDAVDVLVDDLGDVALALLGVPGGREDPPPHPVGDRRAAPGAMTRLTRASSGDRQSITTERQHHQQHVAAHDRQEAQQALHQRRVGVGPGDQLAGRHPVEVGEVHRLQVVVHVVAQVVLDRQRDPAAAVAAQVGEAEGRRAASTTAAISQGQSADGLGDDDVVDDLALDQRHEAWQALPRTPRRRRARRRGGGAARSRSAGAASPASVSSASLGALAASFAAAFVAAVTSLVVGRTSSRPRRAGRATPAAARGPGCGRPGRRAARPSRSRPGRAPARPRAVRESAAPAVVAGDLAARAGRAGTASRPRR